MNLYEEIDKLFDDSEDKVDKVLKKIEEFEKKTKKQEEFKQFKKNFIIKYKEDPKNGFFPEFDYKGRVLGINYKGYLYYKDSGKILDKFEASRVFEFLFNAKIVEIVNEFF